MSNHLRKGKRAELLLVEDNDSDALLTRSAIERAHPELKLHRVKDGIECMQFLRREGEFANAPAVQLILLDLNMPRMDGREVLAALSEDETLRHIPVVILTTSRAESEILKMYSLQCSSYIVKPLNFNEFEEAIQVLTNYWLSVAALPQDNGG